MLSIQVEVFLSGQLCKLELRYLVRSGCQLQGRESRTELTEDVSRVQPYYRAERARPVGMLAGL